MTMLPCFACYGFSGSHTDSRLHSNLSLSSESESSDQDSIFSNSILETKSSNTIGPILDWRDKDNIPSSEDIVTHLELLEKYSIPYVFDIHTHFFPDAVLRAIWMWFEKVDWKITYRKKEIDRLDALQRNKIRYFTTLMYAHKPGMAVGLNQWAYENHKSTEGCFLFGTFYPEDSVDDYVKYAVEELGFRGFKLHCEVSKLDLNRKELSNTFNYLQEKDIPIVIHTGTAPLPGEYTGIQFFEPFIQKFPELRVIIAHMGAYEIEKYASLLDEYLKLGMDSTMVFVDYLATGTNNDDCIYLLDKYSDRIYFGSDFPNIPYNLSHPIENILNLDIKVESKRKILYQNSCRLFGIPI
ncbi:amidohydrolase family protein [Leptospira sp. GIMC2001]|uniref:amidohydrolase family protein n=1 Tax=Leptospira sp. GIMC2001 TaxID=1513297 RepID=UPI00234B547C|nr:amidohydrolase family protein [Leptospira sp. GIMC2001]WCL49913.1 amidohydrolase family protein [Leptospira sp. GIMC2001]